MSASRVAAITASACLAVAALSCTGRPEVATHRVERARFVHAVTAEGVLEATTVTSITVPSELEGGARVAWLAAEGTVVEAGQVVARFDPLPLEVARDDAAFELDGARLEVATTEAGASARSATTATQRAVAELELERSELFGATDDMLFSRHEILESAIDAELARARVDHAEETAATNQRLTRAELELLAIRRREAARRHAEASSGLRALEVRSPHAGVFVPARSWRGEPLQVGSEVWSGQPIGELPDLSAVQARVFVLEADAGDLEPGVAAEVVVAARPDAVIPGTVSQVEPVAKPRLRGSPVQFFGVLLELAQSGTEVGRPGQRVRARLRLADRDEVLVVPRQAVSREGGVARVWRLDDRRRLEPREVTLGPTSLALAVVEAGLEEGDLIALEPPEDASTTVAAASPSSESG